MNIATTLQKVKDKHPSLSGKTDIILDRIKPDGTPYKALYDFEAQQDGDLSFNEGDIITVTDTSDPSGWWVGEIEGVSGVFPSNFVEPYQEH